MTDAPAQVGGEGAPPDALAAAAGARVVSFDVFDTLFYRLLPEPEGVFDLVGERFGIFDFRGHRAAAQTAAFAAMHARGEREVTLDGIYACLPDLGVPADDLKQAEWDAELLVLRPNPEVIALLDACRARGQTCVVTSDMYLPRAFFDALFARAGIAVDHLFVSADEQMTKRDDGALFRHVAAVTGVPPAAILHIGDNAFSDVQRGSEQGLATYWYRPHAFGSALPERDVQAAAVLGAGRAHVYEPGHSAWWRYGFSYGGPITLAFLRWLRERAAQDRLDKLLFLSRDGYTLHTLWPPSDIPAPYFRCSRVSLTLSGIDDATFEDHLPFLLSGAEGLSVREIFARIGVEPPGEALLRDAGLTPDTRYDAGAKPAFTSVVEAWRWQILKVCRECRRGLHAYVRASGLQDGDRVGIVDVGWSGSTQEAFVASVGGLVDLDVRGYYLCLRDGAAFDRPHLAMEAMIDDRLGGDVTERIFEQRAVFELFFSAPHDSVTGYRLARDGTVRFIEDPGRGADPRAKMIAAEIDRGVRAFIERTEPFFRTLPVEPGLTALAGPLIRLATDPEPEEARALGGTWNFDAWGSSGHFRSYMAALTEDGAPARGDGWPAGIAALRVARAIAGGDLTPGSAPSSATG